MLIHWIWLAELRGISLAQKHSLLQTFRDPEELYNGCPESYMQTEQLDPKTLQALSNKDLTAARRILATCEEKRIGIISYYDGVYPSRLKNIHQPPLVLYYVGALPNWESRPVIGVVGTRSASPYGMKTGERLGYQLARCGALVVSGGAAGIDAQALSGALASGRPAVAVLGFGADVVYPAKNRDLFQLLIRKGCLLTEYSPGTPPSAWNFPQRNRIISGLSSGVLVVEAPEKSGAMVTARCAADQGRDLFAVPGNVDMPNCAGSNQLLRERATAVLSGWDVVREYASLYPDTVSEFDGEPPAAPEQPEPVEDCAAQPDKKAVDNQKKSHYSVEEYEAMGLTQEESALVQLVPAEPVEVDQIISASQMPAGKVLSMLTLLAVKGVVVNHPGNRISLK